MTIDPSSATELRQRSFEVEQPPFIAQASGEPAQRSILGNHTMARHDDRHGVRAQGGSDRPRIALSPDPSGYPLV